VSNLSNPAKGQTTPELSAKARLAFRPQKTSDIKTKAELEQRKANRARPAPALQLTPASHRVVTMKTQTMQQNEDRIALLRSRLGEARTKAATGHRLAALKGKTRASFNRDQWARGR
jgi:hypothetical protein